MKKIILSAVSLAVLATAPAHAINAKYRAQLERSGCTQVTEADGTCDIHKTKAENAKTVKPKQDKHAAELRVIGEDILGLNLDAARPGLAHHGFKQTDAPGIWLNDSGDTLRIATNNHGVITRVDVNK